MAEQYAGGLFDTKGPQQFSKAVEDIGSAFDTVGKKVDTLSGKLDSLSAKLKGIQQQLQSVQGAPGGATTAASAVASAVGGAAGNTMNVGGVNNTGGFLGGVRSMWSRLGGSGRMFNSYGTGGGAVGDPTGGGAAQSGLPVGGTSTLGGRPGVFSPTNFAVGAGVALGGMLSRGVGRVASQGMSWNQLGFWLQPQLGTPTARGATGYASQFVGWGGNVSNLTGAIQTLNGVGGYGLGRGPQGSVFTSRMLQSGSLSLISSAIGQNVSIGQAAAAQAQLSGPEGLFALRNLSYMTGRQLATPAGLRDINPFQAAQLASAGIVQQSLHGSGAAAFRRHGGIGFGGMLSERYLTNQGNTTGLMRELTQSVSAGGLGFSQGEAQSLLDYLRREQSHGNAGVRAGGTLAATGSTASQTTGSLRQLGYGQSLTYQQMRDREVMSGNNRMIAQGAAAANTQLLNAATKLDSAATAMLNAFGGGGAFGLGMAGGYAGAAGSLLGGIGGHMAGHALESGGLRALLTGGEGGMGALGMRALGAGLTIGGGALALHGITGRGRNGWAGFGETVGGGAMMGAGIGSFVGPEGALIGAGVGAAAGAGYEGVKHLINWISGAGNSGGTTGGAANVRPPATGGAGAGARVVADAERFLGVPYKWGGESPKGFDCSGLVQYVYGEVGVNLPRTSQEQATVGTKVPNIAAAQPGDLFFYAGSDGTPSAPGHVGIYVGNGKIIDAPYTGVNVRFDGAGTPVAIRRVLGGNGSAGTSNSNGGTSTNATTPALALGGPIAAVNAGGMQEGTYQSESDYLSSALSPSFGGAPGVSNGVAASSMGATGGTGSSSTSSGRAPTYTGGTGGNVALKAIKGVTSNLDITAAMLMGSFLESRWNPGSVGKINGSPASYGLWQLQLGPGGGDAHPGVTPAQAENPAWAAKYMEPSYAAAVTQVARSQWQKNPMMAAMWAATYAERPGNAAGVQPYSAMEGMAAVTQAWQATDAALGHPKAYALGSRFIEKDQIATVHRGEAIIPAAQVGALNMAQLGAAVNGDGSRSASGGTQITIEKGAVQLVVQGGAPGGLPTAAQLDDLAEALVDRIQVAAERKRLVTT